MVGRFSRLQLQPNVICVIFFIIASVKYETYQANGYIIYCPCMGRFGNQAEQLVGSLHFAKQLNRTLVLPPFVFYDNANKNHLPTLVPFNEIIQVEALNEYHRVELIEDFMTNHADHIWPPHERRFYCYAPRDSGGTSCDASSDQPSEFFWRSLNISGSGSVFYKPLTTSMADVDLWQTQYPRQEHPVLAFLGAPSPFPADGRSMAVHGHIKLSQSIERAAIKFKAQFSLVNKSYVSMHIRNGSDWRQACDLLRGTEGLTQLFSSNQCTGYDRPINPKIEYTTCLTSAQEVMRTLETILRDSPNIRHVHVATDVSDGILLRALAQRFPNVIFVKNPRSNEGMLGTMIDVYLMAHADVFIGNCISSFSAFAARMRTELLGLRDRTFYFDQNFNSHKNSREEL